mgnify:FL=1
MAGTVNYINAISFTQTVAGNLAQTATRGFKVLDVIYTANATDIGGNNANIRRATAALPAVFADTTGAIAVATVDQVVYTATVVAAQATFAVGDVMQLQLTGAAPGLDADVYIHPTGVAG